LAYTRPLNLDEACLILAEQDGALPLAGGTDILVGLRAGKTAPMLVVDLSRLPGLAMIQETAEAVEIGAMASMTQICESPIVRELFPALFTAASQMGCWQVRCRATLGGNLCNASPSADTAPPLLLYQAEALLHGTSGSRRISLADFFTGPGSTALGKGELLVGVRVPKPSQSFRSAYLRRALRRSMDIPVVNVAGGLTISDGVIHDSRIVLGAVAPTPIRATRAEEVLDGRPADPARLAEAARVAAEEARPITDIRATLEYRRAMVEVFVRRTLEELVWGGAR
jgi:aerobic carbon-monoxide dehydrogenase medium subunit